MRLGAGQLALYKVAQKMPMFQFLEGGFPWSLECWAGEFLLQSFKSMLGLAGGLPLATPQLPTPGYTSVEKYSVFRFSSAKAMGGCCK